MVTLTTRFAFRKANVFMAIYTGSYFLYLTDYGFGARSLYASDEVLYKSPLYSEAKHLEGSYHWLQADDFLAGEIEKIFSTNTLNTYRLSKTNPYE